MVLRVTTGERVATCTGVSEPTPLDVTTAVRLPAVARVENVTVNEVAVADVTVPIAPLLKITLLFEGVVSNRNPAITSVLAFNARPATAAVTDGRTPPTCTGAPLLTEFVVTTAVKFPNEVGLVVRNTVSEVAVAASIRPVAPRLRVIALLALVVLKPKPAMVMVFCVAVKFVVLLVMVGTTVAT